MAPRPANTPSSSNTPTSAPSARGMWKRCSSRTSGCSSSFSTRAMTIGRITSCATLITQKLAIRNSPPRKIVCGFCGSGMSFCSATTASPVTTTAGTTALG